MKRSDVIVMQGDRWRHVIRRSDKKPLGILERVHGDHNEIGWDVFYFYERTFIGYSGVMDDAVAMLLRHVDRNDARPHA